MNFDQTTDRTTYPSVKWQADSLQEHFNNPNALPFWVADMDFPAPPAVINSLRQRMEHGIYGYESKPGSYNTAITNWYEKRHGWTIDREHIEDTPSVLSAISVLISQHTEKGDGVIIQPPVLFEFRQVIRNNSRRLVKNGLIFENGRYTIDFTDLAAKAADPRNKILILCNPHNPIGRAWTQDELTQIGDICLQNDVLIIADEIHGDIVYAPHKYTPMASISDAVAQITFTCLSPAKTFNIAGMVDALVVIADDAHRAEFHAFAHRYQINKTNVFTMAAVEAAYTHGEAWLNELLGYLQGNITFIRDYLHENIPQVTLVEPEGTFLLWLNFNGLEMDVKKLQAFLGEEAGIALNPGFWFGREGAGFARMGIACPRSVLEEAMERLARAISGD